MCAGRCPRRRMGHPGTQDEAAARGRERKGVRGWAAAGPAAPRTPPNSPGAPQVGAFCQGAQVFRVQTTSVMWVVREYIGRSSGPFMHQTIFQPNIYCSIHLHTRPLFAEAEPSPSPQPCWASCSPPAAVPGRPSAAAAASRTWSSTLESGGSPGTAETAAGVGGRPSENTFDRPPRGSALRPLHPPPPYVRTLP